MQQEVASPYFVPTNESSAATAATPTEPVQETSVKRAIFWRCLVSNFAQLLPRLVLLIMLFVLCMVWFYDYKGRENTSQRSLARTRKRLRAMGILFIILVPLQVIYLPLIMWNVYASLIALLPIISITTLAHIFLFITLMDVKGYGAAIALFIIFLPDWGVFFWRAASGSDSYMNLYLLFGGGIAVIYRCAFDENGVLRQNKIGTAFSATSSTTTGNVTTTTTVSGLSIQESTKWSRMWYVDWTVVLYCLYSVGQIVTLIVIAAIPYRK